VEFKGSWGPTVDLIHPIVVVKRAPQLRDHTVETYMREVSGVSRVEQKGAFKILLNATKRILLAHIFRWLFTQWSKKCRFA
jgi:hypothetical protein